MPKKEKLEETKKTKKEDNTWLFIPGGLLIGMGVGFAFGNIVSGLFIGLGLGMLTFAVISSRKK